MTKTQQLVNLLEENANLTHVDKYARVAYWLAWVLEDFEKEYKSASNIIDRNIHRVKVLNSDEK